MEVTRVNSRMVVHLHDGPREHWCKPSVDVLFRSVAKSYDEGTILSVILTGMGKDGSMGCELIKEKGGTVIAQDQDSSVVWGMPGIVSENGLADIVLPIDAISREIFRKVNLTIRNRNPGSN